MRRAFPPSGCQAKITGSGPSAFAGKYAYTVRSSPPDSTLISPPLEDLSPFLPRDTLRANLQVPLHPKSEKIQPS